MSKTKLVIDKKGFRKRFTVEIDCEDHLDETIEDVIKWLRKQDHWEFATDLADIFEGK